MAKSRGKTTQVGCLKSSPMRYVLLCTLFLLRQLHIKSQYPRI